MTMTMPATLTVTATAPMTASPPTAMPAGAAGAAARNARPPPATKPRPTLVPRPAEAPRPWVLVRGLMRETRHWGDFGARLSTRLDAPVLLIDLPGNGTRCTDTSPTRIEAMAADLRTQLLARGHAPPFRVLAISMGGMVATAWAQRHPQDLDAAVLVNTSLRPFSPFWQRLRPPAYPSLLRLALGRPDAREIETRVLALTSCTQPPGIVDDWIAWREQYPVTPRNALRQLLAAARYRAPRRCPFTRALVIAGARDSLVDPQCSQRLAEAWNLPLALHPSAGHDLPLDDPDWLAATAADWASTLAPGA